MLRVAVAVVLCHLLKGHCNTRSNQTDESAVDPIADLLNGKEPVSYRLRVVEEILDDKISNLGGHEHQMLGLARLTTVSDLQIVMRRQQIPRNPPGGYKTDD